MLPVLALFIDEGKVIEYSQNDRIIIHRANLCPVTTLFHSILKESQPVLYGYKGGLLAALQCVHSRSALLTVLEKDFLSHNFMDNRGVCSGR